MSNLRSVQRPTNHGRAHKIISKPGERFQSLPREVGVGTVGESDLDAERLLKLSCSCSFSGYYSMLG